MSCNVQAGDTPLTIAAKENCVDVVLKLLEHGADVNAKDKVECLSICACVCLRVCVRPS
jgi:Ankyrin repeats (many copies)